jgi:hypothetical protein
VGTAQKSTSLRVRLASIAARGGRTDFCLDWRNGANALRLLANAALGSMARILLPIPAIEIVSMTSANLAFIHIPSVAPKPATLARWHRLHDREALP